MVQQELFTKNWKIPSKLLTALKTNISPLEIIKYLINIKLD